MCFRVFAVRTLQIGVRRFTRDTFLEAMQMRLRLASVDERSMAETIGQQGLEMRKRAHGVIVIQTVVQLRFLRFKVYDFAESDDSCNLKFKWYRRRTIADKMYEFCSDDEEDTENIHPLSLQLGAAAANQWYRMSSSGKNATLEFNLATANRCLIATVIWWAQRQRP